MASRAYGLPILFAVNIIVYGLSPIAGVIFSLMLCLVDYDYLLFAVIGSVYMEAHTPRIGGISVRMIIYALFIARHLVSYLVSDKDLSFRKMMPLYAFGLLMVFGMINALYHTRFDPLAFTELIKENLIFGVIFGFVAVLVLDMHSRTPAERRRLIRPLATVMLLSAVISGVFFIFQAQPQWSRVLMDIHKPNKYIILLSCTLIVAGFSLKINGKGVLSLVWHGAAVLFIFYIILLNGSRTGIIIALVAVYYVAFFIFRSRKVRYVFIGLIVVFVSSVIITDIALFDVLRKRLIDPLLAGNAALLTPYRIDVLINAPQIVFSNVFRALFGHGTSTLLESRLIGAQIGREMVSHNFIVTHSIQTGLVGMAVLTTLLVPTFRKLFVKNPYESLFAGMLGIACLGGLTAPIMYKDGFWLIVGLGYAFLSTKHNETSDPSSSRIRVLHIIPHFDIGGAEKLVEGIVTRFKQTDAFVCGILQGAQYEEITARLRQKNVETFTTGRQKNKARIKGIVRLCRMIETLHIDVVHTHCKSPDFYGFVTSMITKRPLCSTVHNTAGYIAPIQWLYSFVMVRLVAVSPAVYTYMHQHLRIPKHKIRLIQNGIDVEAIQSIPRDCSMLRHTYNITSDTIMINIGRVVEQKNHEAIIECVRLFIKEGLDVTALIVGHYDATDPYWHRLQKKIVDSEVQNNIIFTGARTDVYAYLRAADVFVLPSHYEGLSLALLEAVAAQIPVVCSDTGSASELIVHEKTGYLAAADRPDKLKSCVQAVMDNPDQAAEMSRAAFDRLQKTGDIRKTAEQYEALAVQAYEIE